MTVGDVLAALGGYDISGTIRDGLVYLDSEVGNYATGSIITGFGIGTTVTTFTTTAGVENTSTATVSVTYSITADSSTTLGTLGLSGNITVQGKDGVTVGIITTNAAMTVGDVLAALGGYGISGTIRDGLVYLDSEVGNYATGSIITGFGIGTTATTSTTTAGKAQTSSTVLSYNTTTYATTFPTLTRTLITTATIVTTDPVIGTQTFTVKDTVTVTEPQVGKKTITVQDTVTVTEPVIGNQTITVDHTHTSTVANIGTKTVTVSDTVTVPVASIGTQTILITHQHVCTEAVVSSETIYITSSVVWTSTMTKMTTISKSYSTTVVSNTTVAGSATIETIPGGYTTVTPSMTTEFGDLWEFESGKTYKIIYGGKMSASDTMKYFTVTLEATDTMSTLMYKMYNQSGVGSAGIQIQSQTGQVGISIVSASSYSGATVSMSLSQDLLNLTSVIVKDTDAYGMTTGFHFKNSVTVYQPESVTVIPGEDEVVSVTTPISWSFSTVIQEVTGTKSITSPVVATITVDNVTTTVVTHKSVTTTVVEKTTTAPVTYTVLDTFTVNTVSYKTVTHQLSTTTVVEKTTTKTSTYTVTDSFTVDTVTTKDVTYTITHTFTVEKTTTKPVTITVYGTAVYSTTTYSISSTTTSYTADESSKFSQLGLSATGYVTVNSGGTQYTVTVNTNDTVGDLIASLGGLGIYGSMQGGKITFVGDSHAYITGFSNNIATALKLTGGLNNSYTTTSHTTTQNKDGTVRQVHTTTNVLTTDDTLARQGLTGNGTITVVQDGTQVIVTVKTSDTVDDMLTTLAGLGIQGYVNGGKISFVGDNQSYIKGISSNLNTVLKLGTTNYNTTLHTNTVNTTSDQKKEVLTVAANGTTQLQYLRHYDGSVVPGYSLIISTTSDAGNQLVTVAFSATDTVYDVMDKLAEYGLHATIDSTGRFAVHSSSLTDFDISGNLGTFLMGSYVKRYDEGRIDSVSTNLIQQTVVNMDDETLLSKLNITNGNILLYKDGTTHTIAIDNSKTVGDFRNILAEYGITSDIINGRLQLNSDGVAYLKTITGGSNLVTIFGLEHGDWDLGDYSQVSKDLTDTQTIVHSATMDDKISELTDATGNDLGVTAGQIYVYQDGTRNILNINTNDTLQDLANKLSQYGISMDISSNGRIYLDGNNNSYLTTDGIASGSASNILTKFNILNNWTNRYDSTSETLDYEVESDVLATGDTKLSDLQDASGNNLGITEGNYYVYQNGVRSTEQITDDTTLNDLRATMALYGMTTDFDQNGSMSVGGYNETYLATSATGGYDTNAIAILFEQWDFVNVYTSNNLEIPQDVIISMHEGTKLADINEGTYQAGYITVVKDGVQTDIELTADDTVGDLMDELELYGFESVINANGQLIIKNTGDSLLQAYVGPNTASNALDLLGIDLNSWIQTNSYESGTVSVTTTTPEMISSDRDTLLSEMGVTVGEFYLWKDGVKYTSYISTDETLGSFIDKLKEFGIETSLVDTGAGSILSIEGGGNCYIATSASTNNASNVVNQLFVAGVEQNYKYTGEEKTSREVTTYSAAQEDTLLSYYDNGALKAEGELSITVDGVTNAIQIGADETIGQFLAKFNALGLDASLTSEGHIIVQSGYKELLINTAGTTSNVLDTLQIEFVDDLGGYSASGIEVEQTTIEDLVLSVSNYADYGTAMKLLNISDGTLTLYRDGEKATLNINSEQTFGDLRAQIAGRFADVDIKFEDGYLTFFSTNNGVNVEVGATTDTSNFSAVTGITSTGDGAVKSARELYCVNGSSTITTAGLFRNGDVKAGTFTIGDTEFTITDTTTLSGLISQINASDTSNATAYWDSVDGKMIIKSRTTGAALVNIEAGTSNFTDVMGLTKSEWADADGNGQPDVGESTATITKMNVEAQEVGQNARFSINGTYYTSASNTVGSDISRIKGVTINLKGVSTEGETTLTVERDKETVANAVSDIVDAYNELIENVDKEIAKGGTLDDQFSLKLIRNQIRSLMTSSLGGMGVFRNLDQIGISLDAATAGNIRTDNINVLSFDKDKFLKAFDADKDALKDLLVGTDANLGVFQRIENVVEQALVGVSGYFSSAEKSYNTQISRIDNKIKKAKDAVERYRERLEAKFASMDLLISNMQNQYSSFLGG